MYYIQSEACSPRRLGRHGGGDAGGGSLVHGGHLHHGAGAGTGRASSDSSIPPFAISSGGTVSHAKRGSR
jgi:hypothetical protein